MPEMTGWDAVKATRGKWKTDPKHPDYRICPVCAASILWPDHARASHMRHHVKAGWRPAQEVQL